MVNESKTSKVNFILRNALSDGRKSLYEHEVYGVLNAIGLEVPKFIFVRSPEDVTEDMLKAFGQNVIIKIVSPQIAHKQKLGGVKKIKNIDCMFVQYALCRMKDEVLTHFPRDEKPSISGFLIIEFVAHTQAIGYEVLIGFKEDPAFGPVITVSKGGDDAEFFAKYYDPANLFLPPMDYETALKMLFSLNIRHKFEEIGKKEYMEYMAKAISILSSLAYEYSFISERKQEFVIKAMDINPFVITEDGRFVAIDGFAEFEPWSENDNGVPPANTVNLESFFRPKGIAVVGVSGDVSKYNLGREIAHLLHDLGREDLYFVNSKGGTVKFGGTEYQMYKTIFDAPAEIDLAVYAAPAQYTVDFVKSLQGSKVKSVILISGIPSNIKYLEFAEELDKVRGNLRVIGPNCMGVYFAPDEEKNEKGLNTLFIEEKRLEIKSSPYRSNTALLTQSGALAVTAIDRLQNTGIFKSVVSFGNKYDVKITDLAAYFAGEKSIELIALYLEGLDRGEGRRFFELAKIIKQPMIAYKAGKTEAGARAAASHTASMSGSYDVFKAACAQAGVILVKNIEDHYNLAKVFSLLAGRTPADNRIAGIVNAGFESTVGADELKNLRQAELSAETVEKLNAINRFGLVDTSSPFLDVTPMADDVMYADFVECLMQDDGVDCVFVAIVPHSNTLKTIPENCRDKDSLANLLVSISRKYSKPMVISVNAGRYYQDFVSIMEESGLPVYQDIRSAIKSLDTFVSYHMNRRR